VFSVTQNATFYWQDNIQLGVNVASFSAACVELNLFFFHGESS